MSQLRTFAAPIVALALLAGCASSDEDALPEGTEAIACALAGAAQFSDDCLVERIEQDEGLFYTVRHPDGGFRRFEVLRDGRGLATADGAEEARIEVAKDQITVTVGADRYLFPATVKDDAPAG